MFPKPALLAAMLALASPLAAASLVENALPVNYQNDGDLHADAADECVAGSVPNGAASLFSLDDDIWGILVAGDDTADLFAVAATPGQEIIVELDPVDHPWVLNLPAPNYDLQALSPSCGVLDSSSNPMGYLEFVEFTVPAGANYFIIRVHMPETGGVPLPLGGVGCGPGCAGEGGQGPQADDYHTLCYPMCYRTRGEEQAQ